MDAAHMLLTACNMLSAMTCESLSEVDAVNAVNSACQTHLKIEDVKELAAKLGADCELANKAYLADLQRTERGMAALRPDLQAVWGVLSLIIAPDDTQSGIGGSVQIGTGKGAPHASVLALGEVLARDAQEIVGDKGKAIALFLSFVDGVLRDAVLPGRS